MCLIFQRKWKMKYVIKFRIKTVLFNVDSMVKMANIKFLELLSDYESKFQNKIFKTVNALIEKQTFMYKTNTISKAEKLFLVFLNSKN